jgi:hypothetical protein
VGNQNVELGRKLDEAFEKGDVEALFGFFADDVVAHLGGRSKLSGDFKGKQALMEQYGKFVQSLGENPQFETHGIYGDDEHMVQLQKLRAQRGGEILETGVVNIAHVKDGKIVEFWTFDQDPYAADPFYDGGL